MDNIVQDYIYDYYINKAYDGKGCKIKSLFSIDEIIVMSKQTFSDGYIFRGESHNFYEAVCVMRGTVGITAGKSVFTVSAGNVIIHPPLEFHSIWEYNNSNPECIIFSFTASSYPTIKYHIYSITNKLLEEIDDIYNSISDIFDVEPCPLETIPPFPGNVEIENGLYIGHIKQDMELPAAVFKKRIELFFLSVIMCPPGAESSEFDDYSEDYAQFLNIMSDHIDENLSMKDFSRISGLSATSIEKITYKYLRCGAMTHYRTIRMNKAHQLLSEGESIKSVATKLNFSTQNYFSASFKKHFGYYPSAVKKRKRGTDA